MPRNPDLKKIFVIGSGPIVIGQGCEFDYSGTQACKALREEGCKIILLNSNPATIMTDKNMADATYIAPMTFETCCEIIEKERPDALLPTLGGQTALNLAVELAHRGILTKYNVRLIGATQHVIEKAENRHLFREAMQRIGLETPIGYTVHSINDIKTILEKISLPVMIRSSFTLGGKGSGIAYTEEELLKISQDLLSQHIPFQLEESLIGWKEFEMEAMRDCADNCIIICSLENVDPMGVHTGDSITVAPALTLTNKEYQVMREATFAILREIGVDTGGANVQFAIHPKTGRMMVIEMNPRVSRSSALASKATGYPIAQLAAKLSLGYTLDELTHTLTGNKIPASFEPTIDYVVTKLPRFDFEKFPHCNGILTTQMQSTGEVIGIGRNFQESLQKAMNALEKNITGLTRPDSTLKELKEKLSAPFYNRLFYIAEALRQGMAIHEIYQYTQIDPWFLHQLSELIQLETSLQTISLETLSSDLLRKLKRNGFSDAYLAMLLKTDIHSIYHFRKKHNILPVYKRIDSCAAEFTTESTCLYSTYENECEANPTSRKKILIVGSGPNRIGQGLEFDYGCVHAALTCRELGFETLMVNSNPETVSTDYDIVDRLYLEPLTAEYVRNIIELEKPDGIISQFGGQTALNLMNALQSENLSLLGTSAKSIEIAENRELFNALTKELNIKTTDNFCIHTIQEGKNKINEIKYPIIVRPSFLLSGSSMKIIHNTQELETYLDTATHTAEHFPILIERFLTNATEIEVDGICDGKTVFIPGIMEQAEPAGIHSGDSECYFPAPHLSKELQKEVIEQSSRLALALNIKGLFNIQFAIQDNEIYIIELNPRSSRTIPFLSKALGFSLPKIAVQCLLGHTLKELGFTQPLTPSYLSIKTPVFPFDRLGFHEKGPNMRSTGETMRIKQSPDSKEKLISLQALPLPTA